MQVTDDSEISVESSGVVYRRGVPMRTHKCKHGYIRVSINGRSIPVHQLVAKAFHGHPAGCEVNHIDGNKENNAASNLEWITHAENMRHARETGLTASGSRNGGAKFHPKQIQRGSELVFQGMSIKDAAISVGISSSALSVAVRGKKWKSLGLKTRPPRKCVRVSPEQRKIAREMIASGKTLNDVVSSLGIPKTTAWRICNG
mgnify:CR=1 FL=1